MGQATKPDPVHAARAVIRAAGIGAALVDPALARAVELGLLGWIRSDHSDELSLHAEGPEAAVDGLLKFLGDFPAGPQVEDLQVEVVRPEGHEQFAVRGITAGRFEVIEDGAGFELRLEVEDTMRRWSLPKGPSMDPAVKRMAFELAGCGEDPAPDRSWDEGGYEQGGRVPWPAAIERGHAVFVLHGARLSGGFALQRIRRGPQQRWLLIKRSDDQARRGSDVVADSRQG